MEILRFSNLWGLPSLTLLLILLRPKLQDSQHFSQYRKPFWWPGPVHVLAASSLLSRKRRQRLVSSAVRQQKGVFLQHHPLSLPQQVHGQKRDRESFPLLFSWFSFDCFSLSHTFTSTLPLLLLLPIFNLQEEDLEAQVSFLQGQINDLEAMSKYCARMMNTHICEYTLSNLLL